MAKIDATTYATPSSVWRLRTDAWEYLGYGTKQLAALSGPGRGVTPAQQSLLDEVSRQLRVLEAVETYWAVPGKAHVAALRERIEEGDYAAALVLVETVTRGFARFRHELDDKVGGSRFRGPARRPDGRGAIRRPRFEVLVIDDVSETVREELIAEMASPAPGIGRLHVPDQRGAVPRGRPHRGDAQPHHPGLHPASRVRRRQPGTGRETTCASSSTAWLIPALVEFTPKARILALADLLKELRPEVDLYLVADVSIEDLAGSSNRRFTRLFRREESMELHLSLLGGVAERYETPFFDAVQHHSRKPAAVFHALPISRGGSVVNSRWIKDMGEFYGLNLLHAETSATSGGLDSLLDPHGSIKRAQDLAARAFGARRSYFVTNGTSTANKIVHQSILAPGDVVIADRNCHKSHHYALMLAGAQVAYVDAYPLNEYAFYGAVPLKTLKSMLLDYRRAGRLDEVKMVTLTNCTFDGIVYDVERVMEECLAIKPDLVFLWDEAWFAFAGFHPIFRRRTAMAAADQDPGKLQGSRLPGTGQGPARGALRRPKPASRSTTPRGSRPGCCRTRTRRGCASTPRNPRTRR